MIPLRVSEDIPHAPTTVQERAEDGVFNLHVQY